jgi:hypothetical protein
MGERTACLPPIPTFPRQGGRGIDLPLSAPFEGKGRVEGGVTGG